MGPEAVGQVLPWDLRSGDKSVSETPGLEKWPLLRRQPGSPAVLRGSWWGCLGSEGQMG